MTGNDPRWTGLTCPMCTHTLRFVDSELVCSSCDQVVPVVNEIPQFLPESKNDASTHGFDLLAPIYETPLWFVPAYRVVTGRVMPPDDRAMISALLDPAKADILDIGCGTGRFTRDLASDARFVWGIDRSMGMLAQASRLSTRSSLDNVAFARMDVHDLHFETNRFQGVACGWALHLFSNVDRALAEIRRVLSADGSLAGVTITTGSVFSIPGITHSLEQLLDVQPFHQSELAVQLSNAGFDELTFEQIGGALFFRGKTARSNW